MRTFYHASMLALLLVGCNDSLRAHVPEGGATSASSEEAKPSTEPSSTSAKPTGEAATDGGPKGEETTEDPSGFDQDMAKIVLERGRKQAVQCPSVAKDTPTGEGDIKVTFDGPSGRIVDVDLGSTFTAGSTQGQSCLKAAFVGQIVKNFEGKKTVSYQLVVPAAPVAEKDKGKAKEGKKSP